MARQHGLFKMTGSIENITFYKMNGEYFARKKPAFDRKRFAKDPAFELTRRNCAEFANIARVNKALRNVLAPLLSRAKNSSMTGRLTKRFKEVIKSDIYNDYGTRIAADGDLQLLHGFLFSSHDLSHYFYGAFEVHIDRGSGRASAAIGPLVPFYVVKAPSSATHFRLFLGGASLNFRSLEGTMNAEFSDFLPVYCKDTLVPLLPFVQLAPDSADTLLAVAGIQFYKNVNGSYLPLKGEGSTTLQIVAVDSPARKKVVPQASKKPVVTRKTK